MNAIKLTFLSLFAMSFGLFAQDNPAVISGADLSANRDDFKVIDISPKDDFQQEHIANAYNLWRSDFNDASNAVDGMRGSKEQIENLLSNLNITADDHIVLYDHRGGADAGRFWWILSYYGHTNVSLLDGGLNAVATTSDASTVAIGTAESQPYVFASFKQSLLASKEDVLAAMDDDNTILVDTRTQDEYEGVTQKDGAFRAGRIPGSIHFDWAAAIDYNGDQTFLSKEELLSTLASKGITKDKNIITYCQSGARSAHTTFVLTQVLGFENVANYDGSWIEWSADENLPIETGSYHSLSDTDQAAILAVTVPSFGDMFIESFKSFGQYTLNEITFKVDPWYVNYFWWLIVLSLVVWGLEIAFPWRKDQPIIRKDFWLDAFFMFFNFYIFKLIIFMAFSNWTAAIFESLIGGDISSLALVDMSRFPQWAQLLIFFVATDFIQWFTHVLLHRFNWMWRFHKVHHSVEQMGFAAHLRFHWMENVFYTPMKYIAVMLIGGFTPEQAYIVFYIAIAIGHLNHANLGWAYGPLKYIINNPKMHIWHHAKALPKDHQHGVNFGISLSIWDYIFRTAYIPRDGRDIKLGFKNMEKYPKKFFGLIFSGFGKTPDEEGGGENGLQIDTETETA